MNTFAAWLILGAYLAFAIPSWRALLARISARLGDWSIALFLLPFLLAANLQPALPDLLRMVVYLAWPAFLLRIRPKSARPMGFFHILVVLSIWLPIEPDLFFLLLNLITPGIDLTASMSPALFELPGITAALAPDVDLPIALLTAVLLILYLFIIHHPLDDIGFTFKLGAKDLRRAITGLLAFFAVGLPVGMGMDFLRFEIEAVELSAALLSLLSGYLLIALPEEILFRGVIQNLLVKRFGPASRALPLAAFIFGLAHLNNSTLRFDVPNWGYVLMATLAGLAYGWVWSRSKKVTTSAITHALVNFVWSTVFTG